LVEELSYRPEGHEFLSRCCYWNFSFFNPSSRTMDLGSTQPKTETSNRNISWGGGGKGGKGGRYLGLTILPHSCAVCLKIWRRWLPGNLRVCPDLSRDCFIFASNASISLLYSSILRRPSACKKLADGRSGVERQEGSKNWDKIQSSAIGLFFKLFNPLSPELNPSTQTCLTRFFTGNFAS
jgi:hypothetical protein